MKKSFSVLALSFLFLLTSGCAHAGQQPVTPPVPSCPSAPSAGNAYAELNAPANTSTAASITATNSTDTPGVGTWCYIVQSWAIIAPATLYQTSVPSNVSMATTTPALPVVDLSWLVAGNPQGYTYIVSRVAATVTVLPAPLAPALSQPTTVAVTTPQILSEMASGSPINLRAIAVRR